MFNAEFFVALSFLIFLGLVIYLGLPRAVISSLDRRSKDIQNELKNMKIGKVLFGYRNQERADIDSLIKAILSLSKFAEKNINKLHEIEINPLIVCKKNKGVFAVDALIHYFEEL